MFFVCESKRVTPSFRDGNDRGDEFIVAADSEQAQVCHTRRKPPQNVFLVEFLALDAAQASKHSFDGESARIHG